MTYAEKKRNRVVEMMRDLEDGTDFVRDAGMQHDGRNEVISCIERLHSRREALLKASSIARSMLARAKSCEDAYGLRKAAEEMKHEADRMGEEMVKVWMEGVAGC